MKKIFYILSAMVLTLGLQSCIDEEGAGTPMLKKMHLEATEYTVDMDNTAATELVLRWIDVQNASYAVTLTSTENESAVKTLDYTQQAGSLNTVSMAIPYSALKAYADEAGLEAEEEEVKDGEETMLRHMVTFNINVTGKPIDASKPTALDAEGSTVTATVTVLLSTAAE